MTTPKGKNQPAHPGGYRYSTRTVIIIGSLCTVLGAIVWFVGAVSLSGWFLLGMVATIVGVPTLIRGLIREHREERDKRELR